MLTSLPVLVVCSIHRLCHMIYLFYRNQIPIIECLPAPRSRFSLLVPGTLEGRVFEIFLALSLPKSKTCFTGCRQKYEPHDRVKQKYSETTQQLTPPTHGPPPTNIVDFLFVKTTIVRTLPAFSYLIVLHLYNWPAIGCA